MEEAVGDLGAADDAARKRGQVGLGVVAAAAPEVIQERLRPVRDVDLPTVDLHGAEGLAGQVAHVAQQDFRSVLEMVFDGGGPQRVGVPSVISRSAPHVVRAPVSVQPVRRMVHWPSGTSQVSVPSGARFAVRSITLAGSIGVSPGIGFNGASGASHTCRIGVCGRSPALSCALLIANNRCWAGSC